MADKGIFGAAVSAIKNAAAGFKESSGKTIYKLQPIDVDRTAEKLDLKEKALVAGRANMPPSDSVDLDAVEQSVVDEVVAHVEGYYQDYLQQSETLAQRIAERESQDTALLLETEAKSAIANLAVEASAATDSVHSARNDAIAREKELTRFKEEHRLVRPAVRLHQNKIYHVGVLLMLLLAEAVLNGQFLALGSEGGQIGGVLLALSIAVVNVMLTGIIARWVWPYVGYRYFLKRAAATIVFLAYLALVVGVNIAVAHFRDASASDPFDAAAKAWLMVRTQPLDLHDIKSVMLILIGLLFATVAFVDIYRMDDPYPGYGDVHRAWLDAIDTYVDVRAEKLSDLQAYLESIKSKLADLAQQVRAEQNNRTAAIAAKAGMKGSMRSFIGDCERAANLLLKIYRDTNRQARTEAPPRRFNDGSVFRIPHYDLDIHEDATVNSAETAAKIEKVRALHSEWVNRLIDRYTEAVQAIEDVGTLLMPTESLNRKPSARVP